MTSITVEIEILLRAIQWEEEGHQIYNSLALSFSDKRCKDFFTMLAGEELQHQQWLKERLKEECEGKKLSFDDVISMDFRDLTFKPLARTPFQSDNQKNHFPEPLTFPISFEFAIGHEFKTIEIYEKLYNILPAGSTGGLIQKLIDYEKEHIKFLQEEKTTCYELD